MSDELKTVLATVEKLGENVNDYKAETLALIEKTQVALQAEYNNKIDAFNEKLDALEISNNDLRALLDATNSTRNEKNAKFFDYVGHWVLGTMGEVKSVKSQEWLKVHNALAEGVTSTGGALVPDEYVPELIDLLAEYGVFRPNTRVVPMGSDSTTWPKLDSGITVYAPGEAGSITASNPLFSNVKLVATKLAALTAVSSELAEDSALAIGQIVGDEMIRAMALAEDQIGFLGDGSATYFGFTGLTGAMANNAAGTVDGAAAGGQVSASGDTWTDITITDIQTLIGVLPQKFDKDAKFYCSKIFFWSIIAKLLIAGGGTTMAELMKGPNQQIMGYPVIMTDVMPTATAVSQFCLWFGDLKRGSYLGDRRGFNIAQSKEVYFAEDSIGIRATQRIALNVFGVGTATVAGPICVLHTAAD